MKRYLLLPGYITSADGDRHFIDAPRLAELWGVPLAQCIVDGPGVRATPDMIPLGPRACGDYNLGRWRND